MSHDLTNEYGGEGNMGWVRVTCSCGWRGIQHFAYNDTQYSDAGREWARHCDEARKADADLRAAAVKAPLFDKDPTNVQF